VIVERGGRRGLLLPEVATEFSWGATQMFDAVCRKAGLPVDAWRDPGTRLRWFRTVRFGGPTISTQ
jgi:AMMECR1 domain-containing protein